MLFYLIARTDSGIIIEPLLPINTINSTQLLDGFHKNPTDKILVAIARRYDILMVSCDIKILSYPQVKTIW